MSVFKLRRKRVTFQKVGMSALYCCVPLCSNSSRYCKNLSFHSFPVDGLQRAQWLTKIRRDDFCPTQNSRVCSRHFSPGDVLETRAGLRKLQKGAVPVLFPWNNYSLPSPSLWGLMESPPADLSVPEGDPEAETKVVVAPPGQGYCVGAATGVGASESVDEKEALRRQLEQLQHRAERLQLQTRFCLQRIAGSEEDIRFYTRFASYQHLQYFWKLIEPAVNSKMAQDTSAKVTSAAGLDVASHLTYAKLPLIDELLLFLMYLSVGLPNRDLAERFNIHSSTVSRIITKWINFLYHLLGSKQLWFPRKVVRCHLPPEFYAFPDTQVVLHWTKIYCQTPSDVLLQSEVISTSKSHSVFKAMIGMSPHGAITFISNLFPESTSDREIFNQSGITSLLNPDMAIMVYKGFVVDNMVPCKVYQFSFLSGNTQLRGQEVLQTQSIARLRGHVERCIRRVKQNKLFDKVIPVCVCGSVDKLFSVACYLVNYQNGPLEKATG